MTERRFESRFLCSDLIRVEWLCATGGERWQTVEALLEDISALGACVQVEEAIPCGTAIAISVSAGEKLRFSGHVSYCIYREYGYFVGIRFANDTRWSSGVFKPRHLTNLEKLRPKRTLH
jgi:hypothetical protein